MGVGVDVGVDVGVGARECADAGGYVRGCDYERVNLLLGLEVAVAGVPLCQPGESSDDCADVDAEESGGEDEGMGYCGPVHRRVVGAGDGHQNQSVEALVPTTA